MSNEIEKRSAGQIAVINKAQFVETFNPAAMLKEFRDVRTPAQAIAKEKNGLSFYRAQFGEDTVLAVLELHLISLNQAINVNQPLTKGQIQEIALEIITEFFYLSMSEINLIFRKAKRGEFGKFYGAVSMPDVLSWFSLYAEERAAHFINENTKHRQNDHSKRNAERDAEKMHGAKLSDFKNQLKK